MTQERQQTSNTSSVPPGSRKHSGGPIRQSYALVASGQWGKWAGLVALALLVSGLEAIGAALVFILLSLLTQPEGGVEMPIVGDIRSWLPDIPNEHLLIGAAGAVGTFFIIRGVLQVIQTYAQNRIAFNAGARLGVRLVRGYLAMPYAFHLRHDSALLVRNAIASVQEAVAKVVLPASKFIAEILIVTGMLVVLFATAPIASLLVIGLLGPATYLVLRLVKARVKMYGRAAIDSAEESLRIIQQVLHGIRDVLILGRTEHFAERFQRQRRRDALARTRGAALSELTRIAIETLLMLSIVAFLVVSVVTVGTSGGSFAVLGLFAYVGVRLKPSIQMIINAANKLRFATPAITDLYTDLEETEKVITRNEFLDASDSDVPILRNAIRLESVGFHYENSDQPNLRHVSLDVVASESIGVCGPTGGGKSTLIDIIAGLLKPTSGHVLVDETDIHQNVRSWHRQLGVVSQNVYIFDDTLRRNIALGEPDGEIDETAVQRCLEIAQLSDFVETLPNRLDTRVGENGTLLSGGQRQRVAIARALYRDPGVLILDEGTSSLDNETERQFIDALYRFRGQKTIILVAHRLTTIRHCDRVFFVDRGVVSGGGTYDELYKNSPKFRDMAV